MYSIRKATYKDAAAIAPLLLSAMEDVVFKLIGKEDVQEALAFMKHFVALTNNQYSYENCELIEIDDVIIGAAYLTVDYSSQY